MSKRLKKLLIGKFLLRIFLLGLAAGFLVGFCMLPVLRLLIDDKELKLLLENKLPTLTRIYDRNGKLLDLIYAQQRITLEYDDLPEDFINALLLWEDPGFQGHSTTATLQRVLNALFSPTSPTRSLTEKLVSMSSRNSRHTWG